jgi:hypothetical protein
VDTKPVLGRGAVLDTYNLLAAGIRQLARALAHNKSRKTEQWLCEQGLELYTHSSLKGGANIDFNDEAACEELLTRIVSDARRLLLMSVGADASVKRSALLLEQLLLQDIEPAHSSESDNAVRIKQGTASGRVPSVTDPEIRHGRKSERKRFDGHKASIAVDIDSQIIVATEVLPADAADQTDVLALVEQAETNSALPVEETLGDCAYGGGPTRQAFQDANRTVIAKVAKDAGRDGFFHKSAFTVNLEQNTVTCPGGHTTAAFSPMPDGSRKFFFGRVCAACPLLSSCTKSPKGRTIAVHAQEALLQKARAYQKTTEGKAYLRKRVVVEHRLARLGQLGIGQARYFGRAKTRFQLSMAAAVANLRRVWNWQGQQKGTEPGPEPVNQVVSLLFWLAKTCLNASISKMLAKRSLHPTIHRFPQVSPRYSRQY